MLVYKSLFIAIALLISSPAASASLFRKKAQQQSPSSNVLDFAAKSDVVVNAHIYRKDSSGLYQAKVKRVYKGCKVAQYDSILVDVGSGDSYNGCGPADLKGNYRYLLFGQIAQRNSKTVLTLTTCAPATRFDRLSSSDRQALQSIKPSSCGGLVPDDRVAYMADSYGCTIKDCGPLPYHASPIHCPDGSMAGFTNKCIDVKGKCTWEILECPVCDCGLPKPTFKCHDGKNVGGEPLECKTGSKGSCAWTYSECPPCSTDADCAAIEYGMCKEGTCERGECSEHEHCGDNEVCEHGYCVACACENTRDEYLCHDGKTYGDRPGLCTRKHGRCEYTYSECAPCKTNDDCTGLDYGICKNGQCEESECYDSGDCKTGEVCEQGICKACECQADKEPYKCHDHKNYGGEPYDCKLTDYGKCEYSYTECDDCVKNEDCAALGDKAVCKDGQCSEAQCLNDHHCADDELCVGHYCAKCDCGDPDESFLCHDKVNFGNEHVECKRRENGVCSWSYSKCEACDSDEDCHALTYGVCKEGECAEAECRENDDCDAGEYCENHHCVACDCGRPEGKSRCPDGKNFAEPDKCIFGDGVCKWTYKTCPVCGVDYECEDGYECISGQCVALAVCDGNDDCEDGEYCEYGECIKCDCGDHYGADDKHDCADGLTIGGHTGACLHSGDKCEWEVIHCPRCDDKYDCSHGLHCVDGFCSATKPYTGVCHSDDDCELGEYCAAGKCLDVGACQSRDDCYNPSNDFDFDLKESCKEPQLECSYGQCKASCCAKPVQCYVAPCKSQTCKDSKLANCADDYCGACKARFFTYDGTPTCKGY